MAVVFYISMSEVWKNKPERTLEVLTSLKLLPEEKYRLMFKFDGVRLAPKNSCDCVGVGEREVYQLQNFMVKDELASITERRKKEFLAFRQRYPLAKEVILAQPNIPLSYPIQGAEVTLKASFGTLNTLADTLEHVVLGRGKDELTISTSSVALLNHILRHVTYTSTKYLLDVVDVVSFSTGTHLVRFPVIIRQPAMPRLFDPGPDNNIASLVTITTKTFLRYHKLRVFIKSLRQYYPDIKLIVADDSEHPEKIEEANVEHYIMPFGKGWFAGRNLAISQVTTKYYLWVDDDFLFTKNTKIEKLVDVLENSDLDLVGGSVTGNTYNFKLHYEEGEDSSCLHIRSGAYHRLEGFPNCVVTSAVVNFFLARSEESRRVGFDPKLQRVAHTEFFVDALGAFRVGSCSDVSIGHQPLRSGTDPQLAEVQKTYSKFRANTKEQVKFKLALHYFKNRLKCLTKA
ncbi:hypothetical protein lerEdw1_001443 [Lerista edwardsae]|nr:hypothetical protein lerEdw1_001443 [Lerista edwardsae]